MLVLNIEVVQANDGSVLPSRVRLYRVHNQISDGWIRGCYRSTVDGCYKFISCPAKRKLGETIGTSATQANNIAVQQIERRSQVVSGISDNRRDFSRELSNNLDLENIHVSVQVLLDNETVKVVIDEGVEKFIKLTDVLIGPFDL